MPIYAYKCDSCGFAKDVLQKLSDAPLTQCPSCSVSSFKKQLTAAGFQLKGSGWYATDFKGGNTAAPPAGEEKSSSGEEKSSSGKEKAGAGDTSGTPVKPGTKVEGRAEAKSAETPVAKKPDVAPAAGSGV